MALTARTVVRRGAALLDQAMPGWWRSNRGRANRIDLDVFNLRNCNLCVLGQLYANGEVGYDRGLKILSELAVEGKVRLPVSYKRYLFERGYNPDTLEGVRSGKLPRDEFFGFDSSSSHGYPTLEDAWRREIEARRAEAKAGRRVEA